MSTSNSNQAVNHTNHTSTAMSNTNTNAVFNHPNYRHGVISPPPTPPNLAQPTSTLQARYLAAHATIASLWDYISEQADLLEARADDERVLDARLQQTRRALEATGLRLQELVACWQHERLRADAIAGALGDAEEYVQALEIRVWRAEGMLALLNEEVGRGHSQEDGISEDGDEDDGGDDLDREEDGGEDETPTPLLSGNMGSDGEGCTTRETDAEADGDGLWDDDEETLCGSTDGL